MSTEKVIEILSLSPVYVNASKDDQRKAVIYFCMAYEEIKDDED